MTPATLLHVPPFAFIPHGHCYLWKPELVGLHIVSDGFLALSYYAIPASLFYFVRKRRDLPFAWAFLLVAAFVIACGTTHIMEIWTLWHPTYWLAGVIKAVAAFISVVVALVLLPLVPQALALPSPEHLRVANQELEREIAERQKVEAALRESEEKYRLLFSNELDAVSLFDVETGQVLDVNQAFEELYGYNRVEALQLKVADVSAEAALSQAAIQLANATGTARIYLRWHRKKNGTVFPVELCAGRFTWNGRAVMCAVARDITERQHIEAALRESEERFRLLLEDLHVGVLVQGPNSEVQLSNPQALQLLGLTEDQLLGKTSFDPSWTVTYEDGSPFPGYLHPVPQAIATRQPVRNVVMGVYRPQTQDQIWLLVNAEPHLDQEGNIQQVICTFSDISDRKRVEDERKAAEKTLKQQHELLQTIMDHVPVMLAFIDPQGQLRWVNREWERVLGWGAQDLQQDLLTELYPDPTYRQSVIEFIQAATGKWQDFRSKTRQGIEIDTAWANVRLSNGSNIGIGQDITERKLAEIALRESEARFRQIAETIQEVFWVTTIDLTEVLYVSPAYETIWGRTCASLYENPRSFMDAIHPSDRNQVISIVEAQRYNGFSHEYRIVQPDGSVRWIWERAFSIYDEVDKSYRLVGASQDITERKLAEEAIRLADFSFDRSAVSAVWIGSDARILRVNQGTCEMLHYSREELQSMYVYELDPNFSREVWSEHWEMLRQQKTMVFVSQLQTKDGYLIPIETTLNYLKFNGEEYNFAFAKDISERLRAEVALRQQSEREQLLVSVTEHIRQSLELEEILNTAVAEVRELLQSDRVIIYRFEPDWSGCVAAESVGSDDLSILGQMIQDPCFSKGWHEIYQQNHISTVEDITTSDIHPCYRQLLTTLQVRANLVVPILHETTLWGLLIAHHCAAPHSWQPWEVDSLRQLTAQLAIAIQQSELYHQVQQFNTHLEQQVQERTDQLQRSLDFEALLKRITDKVRDSLEEAQILQTAVQELALGLEVYSCDAALYDLKQDRSTILYEHVRGELPLAQGKSIQMSDRPEIYRNLFQGDVLQFSWMPQHPNPVRPIAKRLTTLACPVIDDQAVIGDLWLYKAGEQCFEELEIRLVRQVANQCAIAVRQARLYQSAQTQVKELERLNHLKDDFLSTISHELRTPMSSIKMATQMLEIILKPLGVLEPESGSATRYFQILQDECQREISLINDLLVLSRLESGVEPLAIAPVDLQLWLPHVLEPFEERTQVQQQHLQLSISDQLPFLETDLSYLEQILTELLNNAYKYTPAHESICISATAASDHLHLSISNSGVEIPAHELPRIFEKFHRVPSRDPWKHGGTGLGLALVERRLKQLQGNITVSSQNGWTTFTLILPWSISGHLVESLSISQHP